MTQGQFFKRSLTDLNSEFSFSQTSCLTKAEELSLPYYLLIAGGRIIGFIPFPRVLVLCEMQSISSRIWTRVAVFISFDDNHCTTGTSLRILLYSFIQLNLNVTQCWLYELPSETWTHYKWFACPTYKPFHNYSSYLSSFRSSQNVTQKRFLVRWHAGRETHATRCGFQKCLVSSTFLFRGASGPEQWL